METRTCPECDAEIRFDVEGPDYEVGLMGYSFFAYDDPHESWCTIDKEKWEIRLSEEYAYN